MLMSGGMKKFYDVFFIAKEKVFMAKAADIGSLIVLTPNIGPSSCCLAYYHANREEIEADLANEKDIADQLEAAQGGAGHKGS